MSAQPAYQFKDREDKHAFFRRRDHSNIEAMQNLVIAELGARAARAYLQANPDDENPPSFAMPANARQLYSAIQGAHGGGQVKYEEFQRDYLTIGAQLQFFGNDDAVRARVRRRIDELDEWQLAVNALLLTIRKGGQIVGQRPDGSPIREATTFIDHLLILCDEAVQRARFSELWKGDEAKGIKPHPGKALAAQVEWVIERLPERGTREETGDEKGPVTPQPIYEYQDKQAERLLGSAERVAAQVDLRAGDGAAFMRELARKMVERAESLENTKRARGDYASLGVFDEDDEGNHSVVGATDYMCNTEAAPQSAAPEPENPENTNKTLRNTDVTQDEPEMSEWALAWAAHGVPVFPVHPVFDGVCTCSLGSECESKGKHPISKLVPNGCVNATTDPEVIRRWWAKEPHANIGGRMGGDARLLGFDVDPRAGGDASFYDLVNAHGDEWARTLRNITGTLGFHLFFTVPEGIEFRRAKLAPGIDLKWNNGYVVLPPSIHATGRRYLVADNFLPQPAPDWLIEELTRKPDEIPAKVINFQEGKERLGVGLTKEKFYEANHERNIGLFGVAIGRWRYGFARDLGELHLQMCEVNAARCEPPLPDSEVAKMVAHIVRDYGYLCGVDADKKDRTA